MANPPFIYLKRDGSNQNTNIDFQGYSVSAQTYSGNKFTDTILTISSGRLLDGGVAMVQTSAPSVPQVGMIWLDTDASGSATMVVSTHTSSFTATINNVMLLCDATTGELTVTLPAAGSTEGKYFHIKKIDSSANDVVIEASGSEKIDGELNQEISLQYECVSVVTDLSEWHVF